MKTKQYLILFLTVFRCLSATAQIPDGYYNSAEGLSGESLKLVLHNIIKDHTEFPYTSSSTDTWDILKETDKDTLNPDNVILFYSGWSVNAAQEYNSAQGWSREHVWAKSHGSFDTDIGIGTDVHSLRPCDISVNSARGNDDFDNGGDIYVDGDGETECRTDYDSWEPRDAVKGDVARMLFYMATRYEGESGEPDLELVDEVNTYDLNETGKGFHGKLSTLLEWHQTDAADSFELNRNNIIYSYQENRNPFIDHPEYVDKIWNSTNTVSLEEQQIKIYPNPASDYVIIELPNDEKVKGSIFSIVGMSLLEFEASGSLKLYTKNIKPGQYLIKITKKNKVYNFSIIISK